MKKVKGLAALAVLTTFWGPAGCGGAAEDEEGKTLAQQALARGQSLKIGVLVDDASPAKGNFTAAAELAESQINQALARSGSRLRFDVIVSAYAAGQAQNAAIDLVNNQGAVAVVSDISGNTAAVNRLNYESPARLVRKVPVTC